MTVKKLTKFGDSRALVIDKKTLAQMGLSDDGGEVQVTLHGQQLVVTAVRPRILEERSRESLDRVLEKYKDLFRRLA
jgi:antitoxin component of MazEF toxin-antitoxin module